MSSAAGMPSVWCPLERAAGSGSGAGGAGRGPGVGWNPAVGSGSPLWSNPTGTTGCRSHGAAPDRGGAAGSWPSLIADPPGADSWHVRVPIAPFGRNGTSSYGIENGP